jgi:CHAT domain-containing protein
LREELEEGGTIYLIPDGALHQIPFGALVTPQDRFWEEECVLLKAPSLSLLYQGWRAPRAIAKIAGNRMLIVSNPAGDFPAANEEKILLADLFPRRHTLQREHANYPAMQQQLQSGVEILHLSLHAFADPIRPLNSFIELSAPGATAARPQIERVFARQLLELKLPGVWLTFLNGCETASGRVVHGEGALSFVRLFALQRVAVVIATLWKNDDWQSLPIVAGFYRELNRGADPATALHRAKIAAIAELSAHSQERVALPYFWAVFEMYFNQRVVPAPV